MATLSERITAIHDSADQLHAEILQLNQEVWAMDGIETVVHLADVPYYVSTAAGFAKNLTTCLRVAADKAEKGGC